jgi:hypothetical protein
MRFRLEFVDDTTCYVEADDFDDDGKTICLYRYVPEGADPLALTTQRERSVRPTAAPRCSDLRDRCADFAAGGAVGHQNLDRAEGIQRGTSAFGPGNFQDLGAGLAAR